MVESIKSYCSDCVRDTNHSLLYIDKSTKETIDDETKEIFIKYFEHMVIRCKGCDTTSFLIKDGSSSELDETGNPIYTLTIYPEEFYGVDEELFLTYEQIDLLPAIVRDLYKEVQEAFEGELSVLSGIGLRTLLEAMCIHQNIEGRNLKEKIDKLYTMGLIGNNDKLVLHNLREIGNVTVHQIKKPSKRILNSSLEIINHTLKGIYIISKLGKNLRGRSIK